MGAYAVAVAFITVYAATLLLRPTGQVWSALDNWAVGDVAWTIESLVGATPPAPSVADGFYLLICPLACHRPHPRLDPILGSATGSAATGNLTGLANRRRLMAELERTFSGAGASGPMEPLALLMIDLDHFKEINDSFGHPTGDWLLQQIGPRLAGATR
jgi:GGDEF domain-containing protein